MTTRGLLEPEMEEIAGMIDEVLRAIGTAGEADALRPSRTAP